jgi:O-antigen ligase
MTLPLRLSSIALPAAGVAVAANPVVRATLYLFVLSIPFEIPRRTIPLEIPTLTGLVFLLCTALNPSVCYRRLPPAAVWFSGYLWMLALSAVINVPSATALVVRGFLSLTMLLVLFVAIYNTLSDPRVVRGVLIAIVIACSVRAAMQVAGIAATPYDLWTGGQRVTILGQNANLSAIILSAGLVTVVGLATRQSPHLPRLGLPAWPLAAMLGIAIVQTGSRGGMLCAAVGLVALLFRGRTFSRRIRNLAFGVIALAAAGIFAYRSEVVRERFAEAAEGKLAGRERIYPALVEMFVERPWIGWGPIENQYEVARRTMDQKYDHRDAHNLVLELLTTTGLLGAVPFLVGLALCVASAWRARHGFLGLLPLAVVVSVLMGTVSGTWIEAKILWLALAFGLAAGAHWTVRAVPFGQGRV